MGQDVYLSALLFRLFTKADKKIIIDIGCNHPINYSNSYFFEKHFLCEVLAFDPISEYNELWTTYRPSAKFYPYALDEEEGELILNVPTKNNSEIDDMFSSISKNNTHLKNFETDERKIKAVPLKKVLK
ncbi:MAG: hypothetical protein WCG95_08815, partial [bacterium]